LIADAGVVMFIVLFRSLARMELALRRALSFAACVPGCRDAVAVRFSVMLRCGWRKKFAWGYNRPFSAALLVFVNENNDVPVLSWAPFAQFVRDPFGFF
jgi:hypothetical protein